MLGAFHDARQNMMWNNRIVLGREGCAVQMDTFADMLRSTAKELEKKFIFGRASGKKAGISFKKERDSCTVQQFFPEQRRKI